MALENLEEKVSDLPFAIHNPKRFAAFAGVILVALLVVAYMVFFKSEPTAESATPAKQTMRGEVASIESPRFSIKITMTTGDQKYLSKVVAVETTGTVFDVIDNNKDGKKDLLDIKAKDVVNLEAQDPNKEGLSFAAKKVSVVKAATPEAVPELLPAAPVVEKKPKAKRAKPTPKTSKPPISKPPTPKPPVAKPRISPRPNINLTPSVKPVVPAPINQPVRSKPNGPSVVPPPSTTPPVPEEPAKPTYQETVLKDQPLVFYRLGEDQGAIARDSSGNRGRFSGRYLQDLALGTQGAITEDPNTGVDFLGKPLSLITLPDVLKDANRYSFETWFYWDGVTTTTGITTNNQSFFTFGSEQGYFSLSPDHIMGDGSRKMRYVFSLTGNPLEEMVIGEPLKSDGWHHLVLSYDGVNAKIYVDGVVKANGPIAHGPKDIGSATVFKALGQVPLAGDSPFDGRMDEVAFYRKALSSETIKSHFDAGISSKS